ncbi:cell division control protein [Mucor velutinosus]|uniref:Cell division control protein n=1 Tax=Mucor velutinosus TaxID=708070 RepID=A0AAN7D8K9_9FUNG|nr:cell division control protein [Mucor velutinosus]
MYSPRRTATDDYETLLRSPERTNMVASPLRAIASPFYKAVKTAQSNASRDFDKFYGNLQQKLTPRTSQARIHKQTPDTTERMRSMLQQRRAQTDSDSTRTSLTPLIERHTLREDTRSNYNYISRNPFYQESVSEIAETPSLSDHNEDTPMTFTTLGKRSPSFTLNSPSSRKKPYTGVSSTLQQKLAEERKRMDKLQSNLQKIRRQSSLLAEDLSATHLSFAQEDEDEDEEHEDEQDMFMAAAPSSKEDILRSLNVRSADERRPSSNTFSVNGRHSPMQISSSRSYKHSITPQTNSIKPTSSSSTVTQTTTSLLPSSPRRTLNHNGNNNNYSIPNTCDTTSPSSSPNRIVPPKRTIINDISSGHLRSAETLSTPGGSRVSNRFWKEIHGLSTRRESASPSRTTSGRIGKPTAPTVKRASTLQINSSNSWANDDGFWSSNSSPVASSLNNKLLQLAQEKDKEETSTHIRQSFVKRLFDTNKESEVDSEEHSLFQNPLFRRAAQSEQQAYSMNESSPPPPITASVSTQHASQTLSAEIEVANKRDEIKKRNNIPTMNADVLAELKARHKEKLIDDADSYKFA